jgi:peroxiredoxin
MAQPVLLPPGGRVRKVESADGTRLHVQIFGRDDAPTIVLAHGITQAGRHPEEVRRRAAAAVLINTAPGGILDHVAVIGVPRRLHGTARILVRRRLLFVARTGARAPLRWLALGDVAEPVHIDALSQMARRMPARSLHALAYHLTDLNLSPELHRLAVPTTVIGGVRDRLLPAVHSRQIAGALPQLDRLVLLRGIGHMAQWEARDDVAELIDTAARRHVN